MPPATHDSPRLLADVGGTWARFVVETSPGVFVHEAAVRCAEYADLQGALKAYLDGMPAGERRRVVHAAVAVANPVEGDWVRMTNTPWQFSVEQTRQRLGLTTLVVVNDFTALAMALPRLGGRQKRQVGGGHARDGGVTGVIGAGSGLGVSGLVPAGGGHVALGAEGGHARFAPSDEREIEILRFAQREFGHVSLERLLSGPGLELIHRALGADAGTPPLAAPEITQRALAGTDALCAATVDVFCRMLGAAAADLAVTLGALGGIYIGGGIVPRLGDAFDRSGFRTRFESKGRFSDYVKAIPTFVITEPQATFIGVSAILSEQLKRLVAQPGSAILGQIDRAREKLSPAERRVAEHVLAHPHGVLSEPIAEISRAAQVSQPTVIRFCRSLGCEGLSDFKLRLASGLTGTIPITHTQVTGEDTMLELAVKVLGNTASAILQVRDQLNRDTIDRAIDLLTAAQRVEFYAVGHYGVIADDAQYKFLRFGVPSTAITDPRLQLLAANVMRPGDVAVVVSSSGNVGDLLDVADRAHERGAAVVAITASQSPLAKRADVALAVDHLEDVATHVPMISRILHLLVIDVLAVGVAMRRGAEPVKPLADGVPAAAAQPPAAQRAGMGISAAGPLARLTSHSR